MDLIQLSWSCTKWTAESIFGIWTWQQLSYKGWLLSLKSTMLVELQQKGHVAGYRSVLRTFISAFIASYEINLRLDDITLNLIFDILCKNISMRGVSLQSVLE